MSKLTVLLFYQNRSRQRQFLRMNNYRIAEAFYLLLLNAKVELLPAKAEKTEDFQFTIVLLHY